MLIAEQRREFNRIGHALIAVAQASPLDWRAAKQLRNELAEALITEAHKQKRERYLARRRLRNLHETDAEEIDA